jgi:hypothetical protein
MNKPEICLYRTFNTPECSEILSQWIFSNLNSGLLKFHFRQVSGLLEFHFRQVSGLLEFYFRQVSGLFNTQFFVTPNMNFIFPVENGQ